MKYCKRCGMLLEDTNTNCIRCGTDVTLAENYSLFPIEVMQTLDAQKEERKKKTGIIVLIVVIFALLAGLVAVGAIFMQKNGFSSADSGKDKEEVVAETVTPEPEEIVQEVEAQEANEAQVDESADELVEEKEEEAVEPEETQGDDTADTSDKTVKDEKGLYYNYAQEKDDAGNVILNVIYPEDFDTVDFTVDYGKYSTKFPISMRFVASDKEESVRFLYMSPQQLWYKNSETGKSRDNERDLSYYMSYYTYEDAKKYIEDMLLESYPKAKINLVSEEEFTPEATAAVETMAKARSKYLFGNIGDYAHIGTDTTYANMDSSYSAMVYQYEITTKDKQMVFDKFYVPVVANNLYYASDKANDRGTVTEWYCLAFFALEAGNEDMFEDYEEDFNVFMTNCVPTETFMYINQLYGRDIVDAIDSNRAADVLTAQMLKEYTDMAKKEIKLNDFNKNVMNVLNATSSNTFTKDAVVIRTSDDFKVAYVDEKDEKAYISESEDDFPGDGYAELKADKTKTYTDSDSSKDKDNEEDKTSDDKNDSKTDKGKGTGVN